MVLLHGRTKPFILPSHSPGMDQTLVNFRKLNTLTVDYYFSSLHSVSPASFPMPIQQQGEMVKYVPSNFNNAFSHPKLPSCLLRLYHLKIKKQ